jgi:hypothetical protein
VSFQGQVSDMDATMVEHFGVPTIVTTTAGQVYSVRGVFDRQYKRVEADESSVSSFATSVFYRLPSGTAADRLVDGVRNYLPVDPDAEDDLRVTHDGVTYVAQESQKDGQGGVWLLLQKA